MMVTNSLGRKGPSKPIRVLYVMGLGRSGSTVLDSVLGNHPDVVGLGELRNLAAAGWMRNEYCSCRARVRECPFWSEVEHRWRRLGGVEPQALWQLQNRIERSRNWWGLTRRRPRPPELFLTYARSTLSLFEAIRQTSGASVLVDSSKVPARALALSRIEGIDLRVVHLIRDGRGVAWSLKRSYASNPERGVARPIDAKPVARTALRWMLVNSLSERVERRLGSSRCCRVRYEDFATDPVSSLGTIGRLSAIDFDAVARRLVEGQPVSIGHAVAGNRLRMAGSVKLRFDTAWRDRLSKRDERLFRILASRTLKRYGYLG